jgi:hypothetical protein
VATYTVTLTAGILCRNLTVTAGTVTFGGLTSSTLSIAGSLTISSTTTWSNTGIITFTANSPHSITTAGRTISSQVVFNGVGGSWTIASNFVTNNSQGIKVTQGSVTFSSTFSVTTPTIESNSSATRSLTFVNNTVTLSGSQPIFFTGPNFTFNAGTSTINCSNAIPTIAILGGITGVTFNTLNFSSSSISEVTITGANTFSTRLQVQGRSTVGIARVTFTANQTCAQLQLGSGIAVPARTMLRSDVIGTTRTISVGSFVATADIDFRDIAITGAAAPITGNRFGDCKGNSGITFPSAKTVYYRNTGNGAWGSSGTGSWSATEGGAFDANSFPLAQDTAIFPAAAYPLSGGSVTITPGYNIGTINTSGRTANLLTLSFGSDSPSIYGNWINGTGTTISGTGALIFAGRGSQLITSVARPFSQPLTIDSPGGSVVLQDNLISFSLNSAALLLRAGTFNANSFNVSIDSGGVAISDTAVAKTAAIGSGTWTLGNTTPWNALIAVNFTVTGSGTLNMQAPSVATFYGGGIQTYPKLNQNGSATLIIDGSNGFTEISNTAIQNITFGAGTTTTVGAFTVSGNATTRVQLRSTTTGTRFNLSKPSGTVSVGYLDIRDSNATGGAVWDAGSTSLNTGNNLGWIFSSASATGNMLLMFMP